MWRLEEEEGKKNFPNEPMNALQQPLKLNKDITCDFSHINLNEKKKKKKKKSLLEVRILNDPILVGLYKFETTNY